MELNQAIKKRRSIRNFQDKAVDRLLIEKLIEAATHAPSACNFQRWKFIIVDKDNLKNKIVDLGGSVVIKNAPAGILVLYDNRTKNTEYRDDIQSAAAAIQNIHLTAIDLGLGTTWICHLPKKKDLRKLFNIPKYLSPIAYIIVGYPAGPTKEVERKHQVSEILNYNEFNPNWPKELINPVKFLLTKILVKIYRLTPRYLKKKFLNKFLDKHLVKKFEN